VPTRIPLAPPTVPYLEDHCFNGRPVLPAVEAMELLAAAVATKWPAVEAQLVTEARFDKFLPLGTGAEAALWAELEMDSKGGNRVSAALTSRRRGKAGIARTLTHAEMQFGGAGDADTMIEDLDPKPGGRDYFPPPSQDRIYAELVPFGPAYRNLESIAAWGSIGLRADVAAPKLGGPFALGSPFVLDAAFHAACVWGQRHAGMVAFPVGVGRRRILAPCRAGGRYRVDIQVRERDPALLVFDLVIADQETGKTCEVVSGVEMRDVSGGRLKPPGWLAADSGAGA